MAHIFLKLINRHHVCFLFKHQMSLALCKHNKRTGSISLLPTTVSYKTLMSLRFVLPLSGLCILFKCPFVSSCASPHLPIGFLLPGRPSRSSPFVICRRKWGLENKVSATSQQMHQTKEEASFHPVTHASTRSQMPPQPSCGVRRRSRGVIKQVKKINHHHM